VGPGDALEVVLSRSAAGVQMHSCCHVPCREEAAGANESAGAQLSGGGSLTVASATPGTGTREGSENASMEKWHWPMVRYTCGLSLVLLMHLLALSQLEPDTSAVDPRPPSKFCIQRGCVGHPCGMG
jgi:hypothetical protein